MGKKRAEGRFAYSLRDGQGEVKGRGKRGQEQEDASHDKEDVGLAAQHPANVLPRGVIGKRHLYSLLSSFPQAGSVRHPGAPYNCQRGGREQGLRFCGLPSI